MKKATQSQAVEDLRTSPMMAHLLDSLERGEDIGHYGRLVFVMVARHFMERDELLEWLNKNEEPEGRSHEGLMEQVEARGYNPPSRQRILEWMQRQDFPICPESEDTRACNPYRELQFPEETYQKIESFYRGEA
jgi:hypothetical protein